MTRAEQRRAIRLLKSVNRYREDVALERQLLALARELEEPLPTARVAGAAALGDARKLRGVPVVGSGIGGAIPGTRPDHQRG
jgi:hypothetical protein